MPRICSFILVGFLGLSLGCGGADSNAPEGSGGGGGATSLTKVAGDNQTFRIKSVLPTPLAVVVKDANNNPLQGVDVTFSVKTGGGSVSSGSVTTNSSGQASVTWTLGSTAGANPLQASVVNGTPVSFAATARLPYWTVAVYMAADNNLSLPGIMDIDEMEAAGFDPEVQVVVQAEFSPTALAQLGCDAGCFNRPNFNTFRYVLTGQGSSVTGPNGPTTDLGNRNMTSSADLASFIQWSKQNLPAQHFAVVLWNHGGGYTGLLADETTSPGASMDLPGVKMALQSAGGVDLLNFDMCLMGGYETLSLLSGLTSYVVFSEEVEPGEGNPYQHILDGIQLNPSQSPAAVAGVFADQYHASYSGNRASTTISAYDLSATASLDQAINQLAQTLTTNLGTLRPAIEAAAGGAQHYEYTFLKDFGNFLDSLRVRTADPALISQIDAVRSAIAGASRIRNHARNGTLGGPNGAPSVTRSSGLSVLIPSLQGGDVLPDQGDASFASYQSQFPTAGWTEFLNAYLNGGGTTATRDQGSARLELYLVWDTASTSLGVDIDLWVLEPNGNLYIPFLGTVTPNGALTGDSWDTKAYYEGYLTYQVVQAGTYTFYADLWSDPSDHRPSIDVQWRLGQANPLQSLYAPAYPQMSRQVSWRVDPTPTFAEADAYAYTDLRPVASWDALPFPSPSAPLTAIAAPLPSSVSAKLQTTTPRPTDAQLQTLKTLLRSRHVQRGASLQSAGNLNLWPPEAR